MRLGAYGLAIFHLIAHGLFKGTIFLNCGTSFTPPARNESPPPREPVESAEFSTLTWLTGFITTLILPLTILLAAHGILNIPLRDSHGTAIFLFFGWATSSQAILTLYRLKAVASWKVAVAMLSALSLVVVTYLLAAERFTHYLFPAPGEVAYHFRAGALPVFVFDLLVTVFALVVVFGWILIYATSHGKTFRTPQWIDALQVRLYLLLINRLYLDALSLRLRALFRPAIDRANGSRVFVWLVGLIATVLALIRRSGSARHGAHADRSVDRCRAHPAGLSIAWSLIARLTPRRDTRRCPRVDLAVAARRPAAYKRLPADWRAGTSALGGLTGDQG